MHLFNKIFELNLIELRLGTYKLYILFVLMLCYFVESFKSFWTLVGVIFEWKSLKCFHIINSERPLTISVIPSLYNCNIVNNTFKHSSSNVVFPAGPHKLLLDSMYLYHHQRNSWVIRSFSSRINGSIYWRLHYETSVPKWRSVCHDV